MLFQSDVARKPQGYISIDGHSRIVRTEGTQTFEVGTRANLLICCISPTEDPKLFYCSIFHFQIVTSNKTYYLTADTKDEMDHWIRGKSVYITGILANFSKA